MVVPVLPLQTSTMQVPRRVTSRIESQAARRPVDSAGARSTRQWGHHEDSMTAVSAPCSPISILRVEGPLRAPLNFELGHRLDALIRRGDRLVLLNLSSVVDIDAAGIGELVHAFNTTRAAGGVLRIVHLTGRVRHMLKLAGLLPVLVAAR
jgi:anti-anti-sigma factor